MVTITPLVMNDSTGYKVTYFPSFQKYKRQIPLDIFSNKQSLEKNLIENFGSYLKMSFYFTEIKGKLFKEINFCVSN